MKIDPLKLHFSMKINPQKLHFSMGNQLHLPFRSLFLTFALDCGEFNVLFDFTI